MILSKRASESPTLISIQALRGMAAISVAWFHLSRDFVFKFGSPDFPLIGFAQAGVDVFFVISGFVMVYSSERLFGQPNAPIEFFARRLARIVPLYWATTAILVWLVMPYASTKAVLGSFFFTPRVPPEAPLIGVGWTLVYEMFFYAVFAVALLAKRRVAVVAVVSLSLVSFTILGPALDATPVGTAAYPPPVHSFAYYADPIVLEFVYGMVIALIFRAGIRLPIGATITLLLVAGIWFVAPLPPMPRQFAFGIPAALIVAGMSLSSMPSPRLPAIAVALFLGDISYALYLTHDLSYTFVAWIAAPLAIDPLAHTWLYASVMGAMALLVASATYLLFERPTTKFLQKRISGLAARERIQLLTTAGRAAVTRHSPFGEAQ
jgi:exopolysaccharide production protein ExoZ